MSRIRHNARKPTLPESWRGFSFVRFMAAALVLLPLSHAAFAAERRDGGLPSTSAPIFLLMDGESGALLAEKQGRQSFDPGDMTKLMTAEVVFDALKRNAITLDTEYEISEYAWQRGRGGSMFALLKSRIRVEDLLRGITVLSADDGAIALAEGLAGDEKAFVKSMNMRAQLLDLNGTSFMNASGASAPGQHTNAYDLARLGWVLSTRYPDYYRLYGEKSFTWSRIEQQNRNPLLLLLAGTDGVKAARETEDGFALVGAGGRDGKRLIVVVANLDSSREAAEEAAKILRWGFDSYGPRELFAAGEVVGAASVYGGAKTSVALKAHEPVTILWRPGASDRLTMRIDYRGPLEAPIVKDVKVGALNIFKNGVLALSVPIYTADEVAKGTLLQQAASATKELSGRALRDLWQYAVGLVKKKS